MMISRKIKYMSGSLIITLACVLIIYPKFQHPIKQFDAAVSKISDDPEKWIERQISISTHVFEQPRFGEKIKSTDINDRIIQAYSILQSEFKPAAQTFYSESGDMPTQESIWQFPNYFVRLYVTSSLDSDGGAIGVFSGSYKEFRGDRLLETADPYYKFTLIEFTPPSRFLMDR